jgi:hypothetical protein
VKQRRWIGWFVLVLVVGALLWWGRGRKAVEVEARYSVPVEARAGLRHVSFTWTPEGEDVPAVEGQLSVQPYDAPAVHIQSLRLRPGRYIVTARFEYADGHAAVVQAVAEISRGAEAVSVSLPSP